MTVKELIEELQCYEEDTEVEIQYRDGGGFYCGTSDDFCFDMENGVLIL